MGLAISTTVAEDNTVRPLRRSSVQRRIAQVVALGDSTSNDSTDWLVRAFDLNSRNTFPGFEAEYVRNIGAGWTERTVRQPQAVRANARRTAASSFIAQVQRATDNTGDQGLTATIKVDAWADVPSASLINSIHGSTDPNRRMDLMVYTNRQVRLFRYPTGSNASVVNAASTANLPDITEPLEIGAEFEVSTGTTRFFYRLAGDTAWTELGSPVVVGASSIAANTITPMEVGSRSGGAGGLLTCDYYSGRWFTGLISAGSETYRAEWRASKQAAGVYHYDQYGNRVTPGNPAYVVNSGASFSLVNHSVGGASGTTFDATALNAVPADPAVVIVNVGHNHGADTDIVKHRDLVDRIATRWPEALPVIVIQNPQRGFTTNKTLHNHRSQLLIQWARLRSLPVINAFDAFRSFGGWESTLMTDDIHPNPDGFALWANVAAEAIAEL